MSASIGSFAASRLALQNTLDVQTRAEEARIQLSTGKAARTFDGIAEDTRRLQDLETDRAANKAFQNNVEQAQLRLNETENTINDLESISSRFQQQLVAANTDTNPDRLAIQNTAENFREEIESLLNTDIAGRHLFSGSAVDREAADVIGESLASVASGEHFQGNDDAVEVRARETLDVQSNITADPTQRNGIQELLTAVTRVAEADASNQSELDGAIDAALDDLNGGSVEVSSNPSNFTANNTDTVDFTIQNGGTQNVNIANGDDLATIARKITDQADGISARLEEAGGGTTELLVQSDGETSITNIATNSTGISNFNGPREQSGAIQRLAETKSEVGGRLQTLENTQQRLERDDSQLETAVGDIENVDITRAATEMSALQNTLQASFAATSRLEQISILNFLR